MISNDTAEGQRALSEFVGREVIFNASVFMGCVSTSFEFSAALFDVDYESLRDLFGKADWETPAREAGWDEVGEQIFKTAELLDDDREPFSEYADSWQEACEAESLDPHYDEAYEHWIVTQWLAEKLEAEGEIVGELAGFTIWGRCTSGQAIFLDGVIEQIYNNLHK